jgi:hypothetical protein
MNKIWDWPAPEMKIFFNHWLILYSICQTKVKNGPGGKNTILTPWFPVLLLGQFVLSILSNFNKLFS